MCYNRSITFDMRRHHVLLFNYNSAKYSREFNNVYVYRMNLIFENDQTMIHQVYYIIERQYSLQPYCYVLTDIYIYNNNVD